MAITSLNISHFRNLSAALAPCPQGLNIIHGENGSGKTSVLEAIHYLGLGRSFRCHSYQPLIKHTESQFSLFAQLNNHDARQIPLGVERHINGALRMRMAEKEITSITELAYFLPIRVINAHSHQLFESGPPFRRKFLDWGIFYQQERFLDCWRQFERVLKQRNAILKSKRSIREWETWTKELVKYGIELDQFRSAYISSWAPHAAELSQALLGTANIEFSYQSGWEKGANYAEVLANSYADEMRLGHTQWGPHRADFDITISGASAKHILSRGQQKLLICAMIIAQGMLFDKQANSGLIYLVDDLPSELDWHSRAKLIALLSQQQSQVFITAIEKSGIYEVMETPLTIPVKVFHVEHGRVK